MVVVGFDGDDTLWHNERVFSMTEARFRSLVEPYASGAALDEVLLATEQRNLAVLGYGVKAFTLSMIETAIEVSGGRIPATVIGELVAAGKQMLEHPIELLDGVAETLPGLAARWPLVLITKGDLFHQESKVARSGLLPHFTRVEIVSEKDPDTYRRILDGLGTTPEEFVMVGDSVRSDIAPVVRLGGRAVHIPGFREWALERDDVEEHLAERWRSITSFRDLPDVLAALAPTH